jgi:hypothetical protein
MTNFFRGHILVGVEEQGEEGGAAVVAKVSNATADEIGVDLDQGCDLFYASNAVNVWANLEDFSLLGCFFFGIQIF